MEHEAPAIFVALEQSGFAAAGPHTKNLTEPEAAPQAPPPVVILPAVAAVSLTAPVTSPTTLLRVAAEAGPSPV